MSEINVIKGMMDAYGNYEHQKQIFNAERQKLINSILSIEQQAELESIKVEFDEKEKMLIENEKKVRRQLDSIIEQYLDKVENTGEGELKISSQLMTLNISKENDVEWDTKGLDSLIKNGMTELLKFRKVKKLKTRLTKRGM